MKKIALLASALILLASAVFAAEPAKPAAVSLTSADCVKCHAKAPADIEAKGRAHKTKITCQDCHNGHPPTNRKIIPLCGQCHEGKPHYKLGGCLQCHKNPHQPKRSSSVVT